MINAQQYEKMDLFYLGREIDPATGTPMPLPFLYRSKNLTTHGAIIGMTGSGKTGLGISLIEEAAIDRIPALVIDPKGDMGNLLLSFPDLAAEDFLPWVDEARAEQKGLSCSRLAEQTAAAWRDGLQAWGQDGTRIARMRENARFDLYTPGFTAGRPVSVLDSLDAPAPDVLDDPETAASVVNSAVSSLLALIGIKADPMKSREHILLSSVLLHFWRRQEDPGLEQLIGAVVQPPFERIGVFPLDTFYPQAKRMDLAMQLNNIIASPSFSAWTTGRSLRIENFLYSKAGRPCISIFSITHLRDEERMFFVTMLLGRLISWMRRQQGSSGLRCLLYMDEIFGFFPPNANPPAKKPMLLLLKQARAYGIGIVLSTQNPVDLDYRGLSNIGTWFIGRLQTRQDQDRVLTGISGSSPQLDQKALRTMLAGMRGRTFLMSSAHRDEPVLFETRWALSYLKGPLAITEMAPLLKREDVPAAVLADDPRLPRAESGSVVHAPPLLSENVEQCFVPSPVAVESLRFTPWLAGTARVRFFNQRRGIDQTGMVCLRLPVDGDSRNTIWDTAQEYPLDFDTLAEAPPAGSTFMPLPSWLGKRRDLRQEKKALADFLYHSRKIELMRVPALKLESRPGESENEFRQRIAGYLQDRKELEAAKVQERFARKQRQLETRLEKAYARLEKEEGDVKARGMDTALSFGVAVFGALFGRKPFSVSTASRSARGMRSAGRLMKEKGDVQRARDTVARLQEDLDLLGRELQEKLVAVSDRFDPDNYPLEHFTLSPRRSDIFGVRVCLLWEPVFDFSRPA